MTDNLISRQAAIEAWCKADCGCKREECHLTYERDGTDACAVVRFLQERPAIEPKRGKWIIKKDSLGRTYTICPSCKKAFQWYENGRLRYIDMSNTEYCPVCGYPMERSEDEHTD